MPQHPIEKWNIFPKINRLAGMIVFLLVPMQLAAQDPATDYRQNCMSCHTIGGGRLTGPDLKDVSQRKDRAWLAKFMIDPKAVIDSGDPYARQLKEESRGVIMPTLPGMTPQRIQALLDLIEAESKLEKSQFQGIKLSERPFTAEDVVIGHKLFVGTVKLKNSGPACNACHNVHGLSGFGGGGLAPDLTTVMERYGGRKTLSTWLTAPATPTMQAVFKAHPIDPEEVLPLVAYFQSTLQRNPEDPSTARLNFVLVGLAGALLVLALFDLIWNNRLRSVRRALVREKRLEAVHE
ncbi:MAG: cytochrome c [Bacteroidetes bacterium]|nr:cytochrome c [Bacteroidota bacterium]MCW5896751.1 cytochrome c [Bacteroidota bacterium]